MEKKWKNTAGRKRKRSNIDCKGNASLCETIVETGIAQKIFLSQCVAHSENFLPEQWDKDNDAATACGMCDIPELQEQKPFELCFQENGHVAVYGASGSGKTTFYRPWHFPWHKNIHRICCSFMYWISEEECWAT